ncbi:MAG: hypothetical protein ACXADW_24520 [Candidatus Hodarchaeales archaeon]|jgi:hypothetical protein
MEIPHDVEELILAFVGLKRKPRCLAQTKTGKICKRKTGNTHIICAQHMKLVQNNQLNIGISPMFISLCLQVSQAMKNVNQYQQIKKYRKRTKGKTYHPSLDHYNYWSAPAGLSAPFNYIVSAHT